MIDPTKDVKLLKMAVQGGNIYHPRIYRAGELPDEVLARTDILDQSFLIPVNAPVTTPTVSNSDVKTENIVSFAVETPTTIPAAYPTETVILNNPAKTDINRATIDELAKLPLVGSAIATKLDKEREKQVFSSIEDLDSRVPLRGKSWEELKSQILIQ